MGYINYYKKQINGCIDLIKGTKKARNVYFILLQDSIRFNLLQLIESSCSKIQTVSKCRDKIQSVAISFKRLQQIETVCNSLHSYDSVHQHYVVYWLISVVRSDQFVRFDVFSYKSDLICVWYTPTPTTVASGT